MISQLQGVLLEKQAPLLVLEVNGVGYEVYAPMTTFYKLPDVGKTATIYTQLIVREDSQTLYGFISRDERSLFRSLIKVNGVGPKLALTILSGIAPETFVQCVMGQDVTTLIKLPGIGRKTAERLIVEMRDQLKDWENVETSNLYVSTNAGIKDAISALIALGYRPQDAQKAIAPFKEQNLTSEEMIRLALKNVV